MIKELEGLGLLGAAISVALDMDACTTREACGECPKFSECSHPLKDLLKSMSPKYEKLSDMTEEEVKQFNKLKGLKDDAKKLKQALTRIESTIDAEHSALWEGIILRCKVDDTVHMRIDTRTMTIEKQVD